MTSAKSSFELVSEMNVAFGNPKGDPHSINGPRLLSQCKNIAKEVQELFHAMGFQFDFTLVRVEQPKDKGVDDIRDALVDISVFALGAHHFMGYNADADMASVITSLYSRFCVNEFHLEETKKHYSDKGVKFYVEGEFPRVCLKSSEDQCDGEYPKGKFLKALGHKAPAFYQVPLQQPLPLGITDSMAAARASVLKEEAAKREMINNQVREYRAQLEKAAFGFEPFTGEL